MKYALFISRVLAIATPALAEEIGVGVGPVGAGVTVGESHRDYDRERDRDRTTVIKEREPSDRTTVIPIALQSLSEIMMTVLAPKQSSTIVTSE